MIDPRFEKMTLTACLEMRHRKNPKEHDLPKLLESFKRFGFVAFPTIDDATNVMVAGHGRCEALKQLRNAGEPPPPGVVEVDGDWVVPVIRGVEFKNERERDAYVIADNQHAIAGGWKFDVLAETVTRLKDDGGLDGLGFEAVEIDSLLGNYVPDMPDDGHDPEDSRPSDSDGPRTQITATITCPECGHQFTR